MIVRWGLGELSGLLAELGVEQPLLVSSRRWRDLALPIERRFDGVGRHADVVGVRGALAACEGADGLVGLGGGSAIETAKAVSADRRLPMVSIPTTYSGAEWTESFGTRDASTRSKARGSGARVEAIVYEAELTLDLPPKESAGSALNALAHCAEALYAPGRSDETDRDAVAGARLISDWLPAVVENGRDLGARRRLLEGAMHAGAALRAGVGLAHAMAQALGERYGLSHGAMNAICLPPALRFNGEAAAAAIARVGEAMGEEAIARVEELAHLAGATRLREYEVPHAELPEVAEAAVARPGARSNPQPASREEILVLYESVW